MADVMSNIDRVLGVSPEEQTHQGDAATAVRGAYGFVAPASAALPQVERSKALPLRNTADPAMSNGSPVDGSANDMSLVALMAQ